LLAEGDENTVDFSLTFDPTLVSFVSAAPGAGISGALFILNTNGVGTGNLGIVLALPGGQAFAAGTNSIVQIDFGSVYYSNTAVLAFGDAPVPRSVADVTANIVSATYQNGTLAVAGSAWPTLGIGTSGGNIILTWASTATNFTVQMTTDMNAGWSAAGGTAVSNGSTISVTLPAPASATFCRLYQP
jgi:hypothetical protein